MKKNEKLGRHLKIDYQIGFIRTMTRSSNLNCVERSLVSGEVMPSTPMNTPLFSTPTILHRNPNRIGCSSRESILVKFRSSKIPGFDILPITRVSCQIEYQYSSFVLANNSVLASPKNVTNHSDTPSSDRNTVNSTMSIEMEKLRVKGL